MKHAKRKVALERMHVLISNAISAIKLEDSHKIHKLSRNKKKKKLCVLYAKISLFLLKDVTSA